MPGVVQISTEAWYDPENLEKIIVYVSMVILMF